MLSRKMVNVFASLIAKGPCSLIIIIVKFGFGEFIINFVGNLEGELISFHSLYKEAYIFSIT